MGQNPYELRSEIAWSVGKMGMPFLGKPNLGFEMAISGRLNGWDASAGLNEYNKVVRNYKMVLAGLQLNL